MQTLGWFGVRCVFLIGGFDEPMYEERVTVWRASDADAAITLAEGEAAEYARAVDAVYLGLTQVYAMADELDTGAEVFSLIRTSTLGPNDYLNTYFDTGRERQTTIRTERA